MDQAREAMSPRQQGREERESTRSRRRDSPSGSESDSNRKSRKERSRRQRRHSPNFEDSERPEDDRSHRKKSNRHRSRSRSRDREDRSHRRDRDRRHRHRSRSGERSHHHRRSRSPPSKRRRRSHDDDERREPRSPAPHKRSRAPLPSQNESFQDTKALPPGETPAQEKQKPNFKPTGLLAKEANTVAGTTTVLKYHEPPEARKPPGKEAWRLYVFKGKDLVDTIHLHTRSAWLFGRDQKVTDYLLEHPSVSKQHAVVQFRYLSSVNEYGEKSGRVRPYLIDLESANGTKMNGKPVEASRFVELVDGDMIGFGESEREYVVMLPPPG